MKDYRSLIMLHINSILKTPLKSFDEFELPLDQPVYVRVERKVLEPKSLIVSAKLEDVWDGTPDVALIQKYFKDIDFIRANLKEKKRPIASFSVGQKVTVTVKEYFEAHNVLILEMPNQISAISRNVSKSYTPGEKLKGKILWIDYARQVVDVTINPQAMKQITQEGQKVDESFLQEKNKFKGYVTLVRDYVIIVTIDENRPLVHVCPRFYMNDFQPIMIANLSNYGKCTVQLLGISEGRVVGMFEENFKQCQDFKKIYDQKYASGKAQKRKREEPGSLLRVKPEEDAAAAPPRKKKAKVSKVKIEEMLKDRLDGAHDFPKKTKKKLKASKPEVITLKNKKLLVSQPLSNKPKAKPVPKKELIGTESFWKKPSKSEPEPEVELPNSDQPAPVKKLSKQSDPQSSMDFDRLLASDPDNKKLWLHLDAGEVEKAKGVGERALSRINYRREKDKLSIWTKLLQIEIKFGTNDGFYKLFNEAILRNNPLLIYEPVLLGLVKAQKSQILVDLLTKLVKKHKAEANTWFIAGQTYYALREPGKAKEILERAVKSLQPASYVELTIKFALLSSKNNQKEFAQTLFEGLIIAHPARTDIWLQYVKMLIRDQLFDYVRIVLESFKYDIYEVAGALWSTRQ